MLWGLVLASLIAEPDRVDTIGNLIICISKLPPPITKSGKQLAVNRGILRVWDDTPGLAWALRDEWDGRSLTLDLTLLPSDFLIHVTS